MTRHWGTAAVCAAAVAVIALRILNGWLAHQEQLRWQQRAADAWIAITANQTAPASDPLTGQDPSRRYRQCLAAVADYNAAAGHLNISPLSTTQECQP